MGDLFEFHLIDLADVALVATFLWVGLAWLRRTRARFALLGMAILFGIYLTAQRFGLQLTATLLQGFFAVVVLVLVVVFQEDLRRFFEQVAVWGLRRRPPEPPPDFLEVLVRTVAKLATTRVGALIVIPGQEPLDRHLVGGIPLDGRLSEPLLLSIFDTHSPGHDGAVLMAGDRVVRFAVHLPLSSERRQIGAGGTRHAAALGLAERTDALAIVVSEERGTVGVARDGKLRVLRRPEVLGEELRTFLAAATATATPRSVWRRMGARWAEAVAAVGLAVGLWLVAVPGSTVQEVVRTIPIVVENLPPGYVLESLEPSEVQVTLSGRRRDLVLADASSLRVRIDALLVQLGRRTFEISVDKVVRPPSVEVLDITPGRVRLSVQEADGGRKGQPS